MYTRVIPVRHIAEEHLAEIEAEILEAFEIRAKVDEIISGTFSVPAIIKREVLRILDLPPHLNIWYVLEIPKAGGDIVAIPMCCEDEEFEIC